MGESPPRAGSVRGPSDRTREHDESGAVERGGRRHEALVEKLERFGAGLVEHLADIDHLFRLPDVASADVNESDGVGGNHGHFLGVAESRAAGDARLAAFEDVDGAGTGRAADQESYQQPEQGLAAASERIASVAS